jgi:hypothetical protein
MWLLLLLLLLASTTATTNVGQSLPPACTPAAAGSCVKGNTCVPGNGCCVAGSPASSCGGCPYCCRVANPAFSKQCSLNTVLILDNTKSLDPYCSSVKPAVSSFVGGLNNIVNAGGSVHLGVLLFMDNPYVVWDMTPVTASFLSAVQVWIGTASTTGSTVTGVYPAGTQVKGYCTNTGTTNWAAALYLAAQWSWAGVPVPDIYIWFTDGFPEYSSTVFPQTQCASTCYSNGNPFFSDICSGPTCTLGCGTGLSCVTDSSSRPGNAEGTWAACSAADALKATGAKLFLVGVGLVVGHENEIQLVTGTRAWDGTPANFGSSDYIVSASFGSLAQLFLETIVGLCACLQAQPACAAAGTSCNAIAFSAIARITTTAADSSTTVPPLSVLVATLYYNYQPSPNTQIAWAFYPAGDPVTQPTPVTPVRTDLQLPCSVQRQVTCSGGGCVQITETKLIPRFFHESTDTAGCAGPFTTLPLPAALTAACTCYTKHYASPPFGATVLEMVQFIWVYNAPESTTPCAAQAYDGTFYEFFKNTLPTYGVTGLGTPPTFPVTPSSTCLAPLCASNVELVFVLDQQSACSAADWTAINYFTLGVMASFPVASSSTRFAIVYAGSAASIWPTQSLLSTSLATWENYLGCPTPTCAVAKAPSHIPIGGTATDFAAAINLALTTFWSGPPTGIKRELLTYVCGPSSSSAASLSTMQTNLAAANVEHWTLGVDQGTTSVTTLASLSSTNNYVHYIAVPLAAALPSEQTLENQLLCPQTNLCGVDCFGFCTCSNPSTFKCACPPCASSFCNPASCPNPSAGCSATSYICNDNNACTTDSCNLAAQVCNYVPIACNDGNVCTNDGCNTGSGCTYTPITTCNDNNACTADACVGPSTGCTHTPIACNDGNACTSDTCSTASGCVYTPIAPCNDNNACTSDSCLPGSGCSYTPIAPCNDNNACTADSCSTSVGCVFTANVICNDGNPCTSDACVPASGKCAYTPIVGCSLCGTSCGAVVPSNGCQTRGCIESGTSAATLAAAQTACAAISNYVTPTYGAAACLAALSSFAPPTVYCFLQDDSTTLCPSTPCISNSCSGATPTCNPLSVPCNDGNACTVDTCSDVAGGCVFTLVVCAADACNSNGCLPATGQCNPQPIPCNDGDPCTLDSCVIGSGCVYTPIVCTGDACNTNTCVGGQCVPAAIPCNDGNPCTTDTCSTSSGGCVYTPIVCPQVASCFASSCASDGATPPSPICVTSTTETPCPQQATPCTSIECRQGVGCVAINKSCSATTDCNFPVGCNATNGDCILANITSLIDFCGVCLGDDASCFFSSVYPVANIGSIAGGAVAGIVIACIIAAALFFWLSKKGYDYYRAQGDLGSEGLHNNPAFRHNNLSGENVHE